MRQVLIKASRPLLSVGKHLLTLFLLILFLDEAWLAFGQELPVEKINNCTTRSDNYFGNAQKEFQTIEWMRRGICIRKGGSDKKCYLSLNYLINNGLNEIRKGEYAGAAGVMALLPTIGALLGAPTNEIWRLMTMVPFGGALAMAMSFGGAILPVNVKDYESDFMKKKIDNDRPKGPGRTNSDTPFYDNPSPEEKAIMDRAIQLMYQVERRLKPTKRKTIPTKYIWSGLIGMLLLLSGAHISMAIVEQGSILPWWCASRWWVHMWYGMVIVTAIVDNIVQLPFSKQWSLTLSDIPYEVLVDGGDDITTSIQPSGVVTQNVGAALDQLGTLRAGSLRIIGSRERSRSYNTLYVMVSIQEQRAPTWKVILRACSKLSSIGVFITGTAMFASAQLLPIAMATFTLTLVLAAGVFGRTIAGWIVAGIEQAEPMMHFVAKSEQEAHYVIAKLLTFELSRDEDEMENIVMGPRKIQVEICGHIFVGRRRIIRRSRIPGMILGILAPTFDLSTVAGRADYFLGEIDSINHPESSFPLLQLRPKGSDRNDLSLSS